MAKKAVSRKKMCTESRGRDTAQHSQALSLIAMKSFAAVNLAAKE